MQFPYTGAHLQPCSLLLRRICLASLFWIDRPLVITAKWGFLCFLPAVVHRLRLTDPGRWSVLLVGLMVFTVSLAAKRLVLPWSCPKSPSLLLVRNLVRYAIDS